MKSETTYNCSSVSSIHLNKTKSMKLDLQISRIKIHHQVNMVDMTTALFSGSMKFIHMTFLVFCLHKMMTVTRFMEKKTILMMKRITEYT